MIVTKSEQESGEGGGAFLLSWGGKAGPHSSVKFIFGDGGKITSSKALSFDPYHHFNQHGLNQIHSHCFRKSIKGIAMNLSGRGGNMMGITPVYKINYIK